MPELGEAVGTGGAIGCLLGLVLAPIMVIVAIMRNRGRKTG